MVKYRKRGQPKVNSLFSDAYTDMNIQYWKCSLCEEKFLKRSRRDVHMQEHKLLSGICEESAAKVSVSARIEHQLDHSDEFFSTDTPFTNKNHKKARLCLSCMFIVKDSFGENEDVENLQSQVRLLISEKKALEKKCQKLEETLESKQSHQKGPIPAKEFADHIASYGEPLRKGYLRCLAEFLQPSDLEIFGDQLWQKGLVSLEKIRKYLQKLSVEQLVELISSLGNDLIVNKLVSKFTLKGLLVKKYTNMAQQKEAVSLK